MTTTTPTVSKEIARAITEELRKAAEYLASYFLAEYRANGGGW